jgi:acyl-CoA synthetase (NDP forming)
MLFPAHGQVIAHIGIAVSTSTLNVEFCTRTRPRSLLRVGLVCGAAGVRGLALLSAMDATEPRFDDFEQQVRQRPRKSRMRIIGPGCCAFMNLSIGLDVSPQQCS